MRRDRLSLRRPFAWRVEKRCPISRSLSMVNPCFILKILSKVITRWPMVSASSRLKPSHPVIAAIALGIKNAAFESDSSMPPENIARSNHPYSFTLCLCRHLGSPSVVKRGSAHDTPCRTEEIHHWQATLPACSGSRSHLSSMTPRRSANRAYCTLHLHVDDILGCISTQNLAAFLTPQRISYRSLRGLLSS